MNRWPGKMDALLIEVCLMVAECYVLCLLALKLLQRSEVIFEIVLLLKMILMSCVPNFMLSS